MGLSKDLDQVVQELNDLVAELKADNDRAEHIPMTDDEWRIQDLDSYLEGIRDQVVSMIKYGYKKEWMDNACEFWSDIDSMMDKIHFE